MIGKMGQKCVTKFVRNSRIRIRCSMNLFKQSEIYSNPMRINEERSIDTDFSAKDQIIQQNFSVDEIVYDQNEIAIRESKRKWKHDLEFERKRAVLAFFGPLFSGMVLLFFSPFYFIFAHLFSFHIFHLFFYSVC